MRVWPTLLTGVLAPIVSLIVSLFLLLDVIGWFSTGELYYRNITNSDLILIIGSFPSAITFLVFAILGIYFQKSSLLSLLKPYPWKKTFLYLLATPFVNLPMGIAFILLNLKESSRQAFLIETVSDSTGGAIGLFSIIMLTIIPVLGEELFFRGFILKRLLKKWSPWLAILVSTILFSIAHFDPIHAVRIVGLGLWLGVLTWQTGSIIPAIICHAFSNFIPLLFMQARQIEWLVKDGSIFHLHIGLAVISLIAFIYSIYLLRK